MIEVQVRPLEGANRSALRRDAGVREDAQVGAAGVLPQDIDARVEDSVLRRVRHDLARQREVPGRGAVRVRRASRVVRRVHRVRLQRDST